MAKSKTEENLPATLDDSPFAICRAPEDQVKDIIHLNLAGKKITAFDLDRVRIPDGKTDFWTVPTLDGSEAVEMVSGVVVHFADMRAWWPDPEVTGSPPSCSSPDAEHGMGDRGYMDKYPGEDDLMAVHDCLSCAYAQFGSDPKHGRGQWCKQVRALFLIPEAMYLPMVIFCPPTSLKPIEKYFLRLGAYGRPFYSMITGFTLSKEKNADGQIYNQATPKKLRDLSPEETARFKAYTESLGPALEGSVSPGDAFNGGQYS